MKPKTCKNENCKSKFTPAQFAQVVCDWKCGIEYVEQQKLKNNAIDAKKTRKEYKDTKEKLKSLTEHLREAQRHFNLWIRTRDEDKPCISCGRVSGCQFHGGHYRTTKAAPQLRFNEDNVHKQCAQCNNHLSGNITEYRIELIKRIGTERVEALENNNELKRYTIDEVKEIKRFYREKLRLLRKEM